MKILLPSAVHLEERLTVSQSVPYLGQQAVRQKYTVTYHHIYMPSGSLCKTTINCVGF